MASFSSWPCGLVRGCCLRWLTLESYFNNEHFTENVVPTPGWVLVLASRLMYENMAYSWLITGPLCLDKLAVYTLQLVTPHPSRLHRLGRLSGHNQFCAHPIQIPLSSPIYALDPSVSIPHLSLIPSPSTSETDGPFSSPQRVLPLRAPLLVRPLLVLLSQYLPSRVSAPIRYGWYCGW